MEKEYPSIPLLNESDAARYLGVSKITLRMQRCNGDLPNRMPIVPYIRMGKSIRYSMDDLVEYISKHRIAR